MTVLVTIIPSDRLFHDSPDAGTPECLCSRCLLPIKESDVPIRTWPTSGGEYRYHPACQRVVMEEETDTGMDDE